MKTRNFSVLASYYLLVPSGQVLASANQFQTLAVTLRSLRANNSGAADRWLQCHAGYGIPSDGAVPLFAPIFLPKQYITADDFPEGRAVPSPGLVLVVSSTEATLTQDATATVDISADIDEFELEAVGTSVAGDYTTSRKTLQVWAAASGPKTLIRVEVWNTSIATIYAQLHTVDSPAEGAVPLRSWPIPAVGGAGQYTRLDFGNNSGINPVQQDADGTRRLGCNIILSSTQNIKTVVAANSGTIRATYK